MYDKMQFEVRKNFMRPLLLLTLFAIAQTAHPSKGVHVKDAKKVVIR